MRGMLKEIVINRLKVSFAAGNKTKTAQQTRKYIRDY